MKKIITLLLSGLMLLNTVVAVSAADFNKAEFEEKYEEDKC